jgi:hypothetical protein
MRFALPCLVLAWVGCGSDQPPAPQGFKPDQVCPSAACPDTGDTHLSVGFAKASINATVDNSNFNPAGDMSDWNDINCDDEWQQGETTNPRPSGVWLFNGPRRPMLGVRTTGGDGLEARTIVIKSHGLVIALSQVDLGGYFREHVDHVRDIAQKNGDHVDLVIVGSTHSHEAPDSIGIFGRDEQTTGIDAKWEDFVDHQVAQTIHDALGALEPATMTIGQARVEDAGSDMSHYVGDSRDPVVIDNMLTIFLFNRPDGSPITAMINWAAHPDDTHFNNHMLSAGFPHFLRAGIEQGFTRLGTAYPPIAPNVLFMQGPLGGQIGPGFQVHAITDEGNPVVKCSLPQYPSPQGCPVPGQPGQLYHPTPDDCFAFEQAIGHGAATFAHKALAQGATTISDVPLSWRSKRFQAHVDNTGFQVALLTGLIHTKEVFGYDHTKPIDMDTNRPAVETEVHYVRLGPASFVTAPGELHPELFVGGYDGSRAGTYPIIKPDNPNPPDLSKAPPGPYVCNLMEGEYRFSLGCTSDYLGYIVAEFNFELADPSMGTPWIDEAQGDHYEETRSISQSAEREIIGTLKKLVSYGTAVAPSDCPGR